MFVPRAPRVFPVLRMESKCVGLDGSVQEIHLVDEEVTEDARAIADHLGHPSSNMEKLPNGRWK